MNLPQTQPSLKQTAYQFMNRLPFGRKQLLLLVGLAGLLAAPLARQLAADYGWGYFKGPLLWLSLATILFALLLPLRLLIRYVSVRLQEKSRVFRYWLLLRALVYRDLKARYARSTLGWPWILIQPLFQMVVFAALRTIIGLTDSSGMNFVMFLFTAILPWNFIATSVNTSAPAVFANAALLKKMAVPREVFVLAAITTALVDFLMGMVILILMMTYFAVPITLNLLWFPILLLISVGFGLGVGLIVAAVAPFRGDVNLAIPYFMQLWFFMTPIFYSTDRLAPAIKAIISINPAVGLITGFRNVLGAGLPPDLGPLAWSAGFTIVLLALAWPFFRHMAQYFADMM